MLTRQDLKPLLFVHDNAQWSFYWDAFYLAEGLRSRVGIPAGMAGGAEGIRGHVVHYIDRYALLNQGPAAAVYESNNVFLTWYHGDIDDPSPEIQRLFAALSRIAGRLEKIVVSCEKTKVNVGATGVDLSKIVTVPLGVDLARFTPTNSAQRAQVRSGLGIPDDAFCIGLFQKDGVGWGEGMDPKLSKGPDVFLEVVSVMVKRYRNIFVLLTGPARGYVKRGLDRIGVPYLHRHLKDYHQIVTYYRALDLYVIPSRCEGGPKALLESWATGVPVVSTKVGMPADLILHGSNGMIADSEDIDGLVCGASAMLEDDSLRNQCIARAIHDCQAFDWGTIAERHYQKLYRPIMQQ